MATIHKLTAAEVKNAKPGKKDGRATRNVLTDGGGLRLIVEPDGNKTWDFRYKSPVTGKERFMGLGSANAVTLATAREKGKEAREQVAAGVDPLEARKVQKAAQAPVKPVITFEEYATTWIAAHEGGWKNPVHRAQWSQTMKDYAFPIIGKLAINGVNTEEILAVLRQPRDPKKPDGPSIWSEIPETARRVRSRIEKILSAAKSEGLRTGENPAAWYDHLVNVLPPKPKGGHHAALPYENAPAFWRSIKEDDSVSAQALRFIILTAVRFAPAVSAHSDEIDLDKAIWTIPDERMKTDEENFAVPLVDAAVKIVQGREGLLFPSPVGGAELSSTALLKTAKRHAGGAAVTTHGFRSTFRDWLSDCTDIEWDVAERALSHKLGNKTQAAYRRRTALDKRRDAMEQWAAYLEGCCA